MVSKKRFEFSEQTKKNCHLFILSSVESEWFFYASVHFNEITMVKTKKKYVHSRSFYNLVHKNNEIEWSDVWPHRRLKLNKLRLKKRANGNPSVLYAPSEKEKKIIRRRRRKETYKYCWIFLLVRFLCNISTCIHYRVNVSECDPRAIIYNFLLPAQPDFSTSFVRSIGFFALRDEFFFLLCFVFCIYFAVALLWLGRLVPCIVSSSDVPHST